MENTHIPCLLANLYLNLRCFTTVSRRSRSEPLLVEGIPGYRRNVNRFGRAFDRCVAKGASP